MTKDRRLGRGLAALLGAPLDASPAEEAPATLPLTTNLASLSSDASTAPALSIAREEDDPKTSLVMIPVGEIEENPFQPRREFSESEISSLAESLKQHDMLQPILVRVVKGRYQLISGERRLRAATQAGWTKLPARVREADDRLVAELAIVENLQRKDLNPIEKALSFKRYLDEHRCTQEDLAKRLSIDRSTIANLMRLLELPPVVLEGLRTGTITAGHARALLPLGDERMQMDLCRRIEREELSVRDIERMVQQQLDGEDAPTTIPIGGKKNKKSTGPVQSLEQELRMALGTKVEIKQSTKGRGKILVHFTSHEEFDRLRELITQAALGDSRDVG